MFVRLLRDAELVRLYRVDCASRQARRRNRDNMAVLFAADTRFVPARVVCASAFDDRRTQR